MLRPPGLPAKQGSAASSVVEGGFRAGQRRFLFLFWATRAFISFFHKFPHECGRQWLVGGEDDQLERFVH
jgi:hypothetical protein